VTSPHPAPAAAPPALPAGPYGDAFFAALTDGSLASARVVVPILLEFVRPRRVVDVGCGRGEWLRAFRENGTPVVRGLDGAYVDPAKLLIDPADFTPTDLSRPFTVDGRFDLAISLEVAEHLPPRAARGLVRALTAAAPLVLFSAAIPGQGGTSHVNLQWPEYWQGLFGERGYRRLDPIRPRIWRDRRVAIWYRQNLFLYAAPAALAESAPLQAAAEGADLELIDAAILRQYKTLRGLLAAAPPALWRAIRRRLPGGG
jgi:SAM-dependent methyltransferase